MASRRNVRYAQLPDYESDDEFASGKTTYDARFDYTPDDRVPWKSIALALALLFLGSSLLLVTFFIFTGHMEGDSSQGYALLVLGILTFLPGFYETRVAYYSWRGADGYRFSSIPSY